MVLARECQGSMLLPCLAKKKNDDRNRGPGHETLGEDGESEGWERSTPYRDDCNRVNAHVPILVHFRAPGLCVLCGGRNGHLC